jgi:hypothetical protein
LIKAYATELVPQSEKFFQLKETQLRQMAYGNATTMLYEILVRASVIKYAEAHNLPTKYSLAMERNNGFIWIDSLFSALTDYENHREQYPTLRSYMPEIIKMQNRLNPTEIYEEQESHKPVIIGTNIENGDRNVDSSIDKIIVKFDKSMNTGMNGSSWGKKGKEYAVNSVGAQWDEQTKKEWILDVKLEPNTEYSISFPAQFFLTEDYYSPKATYYLDFKTK